MTVDYGISGSDRSEHSGAELAVRLARQVPIGTHLRIALHGRDEVALAAVAMHLLAEGRQVVLWPFELDASRLPLGSSLAIELEPGELPALAMGDPHSQPDESWNVALYSSGSTRVALPFGFTLEQVKVVTGWYQTVYGLSTNSVIVTGLPATYNFAFIAGACLAASVGCRLHLSESPQRVLHEARILARDSDRCIVLANPAQLQLMADNERLPGNILIDSGGAPLSTTAIRILRDRVADIREGYGLTENCSLTHFDTEGTEQSIGTVGAAMPGVTARTVEVAGKPRVAIFSPAMGVSLADGGITSRAPDVTGDLGVIDGAGRLRLLGREDDCCVNGSWPRDTLDMIGGLLGSRCARVQQPSERDVDILLMGDSDTSTVARIKHLVATNLQVAPERVVVGSTVGPALHSRKLPRNARAVPTDGDRHE
jgi:hypothetical protein